MPDEAVAFLRGRGIAAMALCHPHFSTGTAAWSAAPGDIPVLIHADDKAWITDPSLTIQLWHGENCQPAPDSELTLIRCGGHFLGIHVLIGRPLQKARVRC